MINALRRFFAALAGTPVPSSPALPAPPKAPATPTTSSWSPPVTVAIVNQCSVLTDAQVTPVVAAIQTQVTRDFAPVWAVDAKIIQVNKGATIPANAWPIYLLDTSDTDGALGYHDDSTGVPYGRVFVKTDMDNNAIWSVTLSHEVLELLADPFIISLTLGKDSYGRPRIYALEVCDAPEADQFGYDINGVKVSDFVYPAWFGSPNRPGGKFDHMGHITAPYQLLSGGYISYLPVATNGSWKQITAKEMGIHPHREKISEGARRQRRKAQTNFKPVKAKKTVKAPKTTE